jgi:hypothetical protein
VILEIFFPSKFPPPYKIRAATCYKLCKFAWSQSNCYLNIISVSKSKEASPWKDNSCSTTQDIHSISWNPKPQYRWDPSWARRIEPVLLSCFSKMNFSITVLPTSGHNCWPLSFSLSYKTMHIFLFSSMRVLSPAHLTFLDVIILTTSGYEFKL